MKDLTLIIKKLNKARQEFIKKKEPVGYMITFLTPHKKSEVVKSKYRQITLEDGIAEAEKSV